MGYRHFGFRFPTDLRNDAAQVRIAHQYWPVFFRAVYIAYGSIAPNNRRVTNVCFHYKPIVDISATYGGI